MNFNLREPNPGDKISANLIREIIRAIRSLTPIKGPGMKISQGPNGTTYASEHVNKKKGSATIRPWTFRCTVTNPDTDNETRTGGWYNCRMQIGLNANVVGRNSEENRELGNEETAYRITGLDQTEDGIYYAEVDLYGEEAELKISEDENVPDSDYANNKVNVFIGKVEDGVQTMGIFCVPCVYKRLD